MLEHRDGNDARSAGFEAEHWLAWLFSAGAIVLGVIGLLRAYGVFGPANGNGLGQRTSISPGGLPDSLWDGGVLLLAAFAAALLAWALHHTEHHRMRDLAGVPSREAGLWKTEHGLAYLMALASIVFAVIGLLTAYNKIGGHHFQPDGIPWLFVSIGAALLTSVFHSVEHHQLIWLAAPAGTVQTTAAEPATGYTYQAEGPAPAARTAARERQAPRR